MSTTKIEKPNVNFYKYYDSIFIVVRKAIFRVFVWLYKGGTQYVGDYLKTTTCGMQRLGKIEKDALIRKEPPSKFDIPFLCTLLQHTCGLARDTDEICHKPRTSCERKSLEYSLYLLKEKRNSLCNDPQPLIHMNDSDLDLRLNELRDLCRHILQEAGQRANRPNDHISNCINNVEKEFDDIRTKSSSITAGKFAVVAKQEIKKRNQHALSTINQFVLPYIYAEEGFGHYETPLTIFSSWRCRDGSLPTFIMLKGETGSGKSTVCRYIFESWIASNQVIPDLQNYDLVIPVVCCNVFTRDLVDFLIGIVGDTKSWCSHDETRGFLRSLRILWLIDGFEEATAEARELLKEIEKQGESHLIFLTTKPQNCKDVTETLTSKNSVCEVVLSGLSDEGVLLMTENLLGKKEKDMRICRIQGLKFFEDVEVLGVDVVSKLKVPLKLQLMLDLWQEGRLVEESVSSIYQLYKATVEVHSRKLFQKIKSKCTLRDSEISKRINEWKETLYKIAYDMTLKKKFVKIDEPSQEKLVVKALNLSISHEDCLSTFLQSESSDLSGKPSYCLMHNTHQYFLAAQHVCLLLRQSTEPRRALKKLFHEKIKFENESSHNHLYMVLLQVVSSTALQHPLDQALTQTLIELLSTCNEFDAFEVVHYASYNEIFVKEASKFNEKKWLIADHRIKAATVLLNYATPVAVHIMIYRDPKYLPDLNDLIHMVSKKTLLLVLDLGYHYLTLSEDYSDSYLAPICSPEAKCNLIGFTGNLSTVGCQYLLKLPRIFNLCLKISSNELLDRVLQNLKHIHRLLLLTLNLRMPVVETSVNLYDLKVDEFVLNMSYMDESQAEKTVKSLRNVHHAYTLIVINTSDAHAENFMHMLENNDIKVRQVINARSAFGLM